MPPFSRYFLASVCPQTSGCFYSPVLPVAPHPSWCDRARWPRLPQQSGNHGTWLWHSWPRVIGSAFQWLSARSSLTSGLWSGTEVLWVLFINPDRTCTVKTLLRGRVGKSNWILIINFWTMSANLKDMNKRRSLKKETFKISVKMQDEKRSFCCEAPRFVKSSQNSMKIYRFLKRDCFIGLHVNCGDLKLKQRRIVKGVTPTFFFIIHSQESSVRTDERRSFSWL